MTLTASLNSTCDTFTGWSGGGCTGTGTCTVTMTMAKTVSASFGTTGATWCLPVIIPYGERGPAKLPAPLMLTMHR